MNIDVEKLKDQFTNLDPENIGNWPIVVRIVIVLAVCAAVLGGGYYFDTQDQQVEIEKQQVQEVNLWKDFETKQKKAASLDAYKAQMVEMEESFGTMLRQLPSKNEVADLLVDVTQTGLANGLEFDLFKPSRETAREFYAELPISISVNGSFHNLAGFVSGVAALPRIVTIHNITLNVSGQSRQLKMTGTAKTYRYLDEEEIASAAASKRKKGKKKR